MDDSRIGTIRRKTGDHKREMGNRTDDTRETGDQTGHTREHEMNNQTDSTREIVSLTDQTGGIDKIHTMDNQMDKGEAEDYVLDAICQDMKSLIAGTRNRDTAQLP